MKRWNPTLAMTVLLAAHSQGEPLALSDVSLEGWRLTLVPFQQTVEIAPPKRVEATHVGELKSGTPGWRGPLLLPGPAWAYGALRSESLTATLAQAPETALEVGKDFALDPAWAAVAALPGSATPEGTQVRFAYQYALSRLDRIELTPDGKVVVVPGVEDKTQPRLPAATPGNRSLLAVYLPNHATALAPGFVLPIDPDYDGVPPVAGTERLAPLKQKLAGEAPVTIVFLGDSIVAQPARDFRDGRGSFAERFTEWLRTAYPGRTVVSTRLAETVAPLAKQTVVVLSGVGGNDSDGGLARLDKDVLAHRPDLVVAMFGVNDENRAAAGGNTVPVERYRANLAAIVRGVREQGGETLLLTPSMKNPDWNVTVGNLNEYAQGVREVAQDPGAVLVDAFRAWELLPARGYHPMVFLGNCINHPVDLGHDLFFRGLRAAFGDRSEASDVPAAPPAEHTAVPALCACQPDAPVGRVGEVRVREGDALQGCRIETFALHSVAMRRDIDVSVLLPPAYLATPERTFPVLYALHGKGAPYATWLEMAPLRRALADTPMVVVAFNGDAAGWYLDAPGKPYSQFTTFFFEELAPWVERTVRIAPDQRAVTGFSMGGHGAYHYLMTRPDFFVSVSALSSAFTYFGEAGRPERPFLEPLLGAFEENTERYASFNLRLRFAAAAREGVALPPLFLGCGTEDKGLESCRAFRDFIAGLGYPPEYEEAPGEHAWPYWRDTSPAVVAFHARAFESEAAKLPPRPAVVPQ